MDIYWLHLPTDIEEHLNEIIELYNEGKIKHIGVSNFTLEECKRSKDILDKAGIALYGVQNHFSIICREWEKNGLLQWCKDNDVSFWGWAVLEEGLLVDPRIPKKSTMKFAFKRKVKKLAGLYKVMIKVAELAEAARVVLTSGEIKRLEEAADAANVKIMGADIFRPFVLKSKK